jgi:dTDP-4-amino-4,6-dideoxygalactose transaminase
MQTAYKNLGYQKGDFPVTEEYSQNILSLPMYAEITSDQINHITNSILEFE